MKNIILWVKKVAHQNLDKINETDKNHVAIFYREKKTWTSSTWKMTSLEETLDTKWYNISLNETLKWWAVSQIYAWEFNWEKENTRKKSKKVVIKHTNDLIPYDPTEIFISKQWHNTDSEILKHLKQRSILVPHIIKHFPDITTTIMEDVRDQGYELLQFAIDNNKLPIKNAKTLWRDLAQLNNNLANFTGELNECAEESFYERAFELRLFYPNNQQHFEDLHQEFCTNSQKVIRPDGHPKNIFTKEDWTNMFIDFWRSHFGDPRYILPNFLAHIVIYTLLWNINKTDAKTFFTECIIWYEEHKQDKKINEALFCKYLAMEVAHRFAGKRINWTFTSTAKQKLMGFALDVFDNKVNTIEKLITYAF